MPNWRGKKNKIEGALGFSTLVLIFPEDCIFLFLPYQKLWKLISILHAFKWSFKAGSPETPLTHLEKC